MAVFGEELKRLRLELGLNQTAFGKAVGYSRTLVSNWERLLDDPFPPRHEIEAWEEKLDLSPGQVDCLLVAAGYQPRYGTNGEHEAAGVLRAGEVQTREIRADVLRVGRIDQLGREELTRLRLDLLPRLGESGLAESQVPLRADLRRHFDGLLQDYALFGGRADEIAAITTFLADPQDGYLFLAGPSGYGKTALLVQLARQGQATYCFLNRTYGTTDEDLFLRNLCQQLAARHSLGGRLPASTAELRALYPDLLRLPPADGRPVVVLLDGLDEAVNWEISPLLFPPDLPDGVKVIFSARQVAERDWLNHLRLPAERVQRLTLGALTTDDVRSLLSAAGGIATPLADDPGWIAQVLRVSSGDPFYVKLLVEDIRDGRMRPEQIGGQPAGLDAYLKGWWEQVAAAVRAQDVRDLLGSLTVARGLLARDDLIAMFPELGWALDGVLTEVRRFVTGDERQGYALCHPRFADYVRRRVGKRALQTYTNALLQHCANWREHHSPYALTYYAGHLAETGRWEELHTLVATGDRCQEWAETRNANEGSYAGYLRDLSLAWMHVDDVGRAKPAMIGRQARYALIQASVNSLASNVPPELLVALVREGLWSGKAALGYARLITDDWQRFEALRQLGGALRQQEEAVASEALADAFTLAQKSFEAARRARDLILLAPDLSPELHLAALTDALNAAREVQDPDDRLALLTELISHLPIDQHPVILSDIRVAAQMFRNVSQGATALAALMPHLSPEQRLPILTDALAAMRDQDEFQSPRSLTTLAPHLSPHLLSIALTTAKEIRKPYDRGRALADLVPYLSADQRLSALTDALATLREIEDGVACTTLLADLAPHLPPDLLQAALALAKGVQDDFGRSEAGVEALVALEPYLPIDQRVVIVADALAMAREIQNAPQRAKALASVALLLPNDLRLALLNEVLTLTKEITDSHMRRVILEMLSSHLPPILLPDALAIARDTHDSYSRTVMVLIPYLPPDLLGDALRAVRETRDPYERACDLSKLARYLPDNQRQAVLEEALSVARELDAYHRSYALEVIARRSPPEQRPAVLAEALAAVQECRVNQNLSFLGNDLGSLIPILPPALLPDALAVTRTMNDIVFRFRALNACVPHLPSQLLSDALAAAREIQSAYHRAEALVALAPHLPLNKRSSVLSEALATARQLRYNEHALHRVLAALTPLLSPDLVPDALEMSQGIQTPYLRACALTTLVPYLSPDQRAVAVVESLATVSKIGEKPYTQGAEQRARILVTLAPDLPPDLMPNALAAAQDIWAPYSRHVALIALLPYLPPDLVSSALTMIQEIQATEPNPEALAVLIPHLEPDLLPDVLAAVHQIPHDYGRRRVLTALAPYLPMDLLPDALASALSIEEEPFRARVLVVLIRHLPPDLLPRTLAAAQEIQSPFWRYRVLVALALRLPIDQRLGILTGALAAVLRMASDAINPAVAFSRVAWFGVGDDPDEPPMPRTEGFAALTPLWASLLTDQAYSPWPSTLRACAMDSRADLIVDLRALTPVIAALGGTAAVAETFRALQDVGRWWP